MTNSNTNKQAAKASIGYTIGNVLIKGLSFLTLPIFTRLMSPSDYGLYSTYVAYESIFTIIISLALYASLKNANIDFKGKIDEYVSTIILLPIIFATLLVCVSFFYKEALQSFFGFNGFLVILMIIQSLASTIVTMYNARIGLNYAYKAFVWISMFTTIGNVLISLVLILTVFKSTPYVGRIIGTFSSITIIAIFLLCNFLKISKPSFGNGYIKYGLSYSLPLIPHGLSQIILAQFGKIILQKQIGNAAAGIYGFAYTIALIPQIVIQSLGMAWGPYFFEKYEQQQFGEIKIRTNQYVAAFSFLMVALFCVSPEIIKLMSDKSYWDSINIVCPALLGVYFTFLYGIPVEIEYFYKKTSYIAIGTGLAAVFNVILCLIFVRQYSYIGVIYITLFTYIMYFIAHMTIAYHISGKQLPFDMKELLFLIISTCISCVLVQISNSIWLFRYGIILIWCALIYSRYKGLINIISAFRK